MGFCMQENKNIPFDKLDQKIFKELPFLVDVFAAWGNKVSSIFAPMQDEIEVIIEKNIKPKRFWQIKYNKKNVFYPFTGDEYSNQTKITKLDSIFSIENFFNVAKIIDGKWKNYFMVEFGYWFETEDITNKESYFYFGLGKGDDYAKFGGEINNKDFYKSIKVKNSKVSIEISHPDIDGEAEYIQLKCSELDIQKINSLYVTFRDKVLIPFLKSVK